MNDSKDKISFHFNLPENFVNHFEGVELLIQSNSQGKMIAFVPIDFFLDFLSKYGNQFRKPGEALKSSDFTSSSSIPEPLIQGGST